MFVFFNEALKESCSSDIYGLIMNVAQSQATGNSEKHKEENENPA